VSGSALEQQLAWLIRVSGLPVPVYQFKFHPTRRWKFDAAYPDRWLAIEVMGGAWVQGHHSRGQGVEDDAEKLSHAAMAGWRVLVFTGQQIKDGRALQWLEAALRHRPEQIAGVGTR